MLGAHGARPRGEGRTKIVKNPRQWAALSKILTHMGSFQIYASGKNSALLILKKKRHLVEVAQYRMIIGA
jgi:hypothetical protein